MFKFYADLCVCIGCFFFFIGGVINTAYGSLLVGIAMILIALANLLLML